MPRALRLAILLLPLFGCGGADGRAMDLSDPAVLASHQKKQLEGAAAISRASDSITRSMTHDEAAIQLADRPATPVDSLAEYRARVDSLRTLNRSRLVTITHLHRQLDALGPGVQFVNDSLRVARRHLADLETLLLRREQRIVQLETEVDSLLRANGILVEANAGLRDTIVVLRDTIFGLRHRVDSVSGLTRAPAELERASTANALYAVLTKEEVQRMDLVGADDFLRCDRMPSGSVALDSGHAAQIRLPRTRKGYDLVGRPDVQAMQQAREAVWSFDDETMLFTIHDAERFWRGSSCLVFVTQ